MFPKWLEVCLDWGISEFDFWQMTIGELGRAIDSKKRIKELDLKEKATFHYILADLIGRSVSRAFDSNNTYPEIYEAYPSFFDGKKIQEEKAKKADKVSAIRFTQFANSFNKRFKEANKQE